VPIERPRHGGNLVWASALAGCSPHLILDFSASINPLGPPLSAIAAIQAALPQIVHYPDPSYRELRQAIAAFHSADRSADRSADHNTDRSADHSTRHSTDQLDPDWILPGNGAAELLTWAGREMAELDQVLLMTPAFSDYGRSLRAADANILSVKIELEANEDQPLIDLKGIDPSRSAILVNNPHNPTGRLFSVADLTPLLQQFALVVVDEAFMDFLRPLEQESLLDQVQHWPNLVVLRSLTKFYSLPGLRLGYAVSHPDRLIRWQNWRDPWSVNWLAAAAGMAGLQDQSFQQATWQWLAAARSQLFSGLSEIPGLRPLPGSANFLLVESEQSVVQLQADLLRNSQVLIRDCLSFAELGDRFFRVAVRTAAENQRLLEGLLVCP
jgi:histidinol-phosphate/aromatic aminotransferase/cobyric acid decarboxylase-like protein